MLYNLCRAARRRFARPDFARILKTPPVLSRDDGALVVSQLQHADVLQYLVAAKSFAHYTGFGRFALLDDGTLTAPDRALLVHHLPAIAFHAMRDVRRGSLPAGGTWERLITIAELSADRYVIQLDADTVTRALLDEVGRCVARGRSFAIMAGQTAQMLPLATIAELARTLRKNDHIQIAAEARLDALDSALGTRYGCGSSGFAGFRPDPQRRVLLERFSARMEELLGARWHEWGSEQVASNFLVAQDAAGILLPYRRYRNFDGEALTADAVFVHFFGTFRHARGTYRRMARETAALLSAQASRPANGLIDSAAE